MRHQGDISKGCTNVKLKLPDNLAQSARLTHLMDVNSSVVSHRAIKNDMVKLG